MRWLATAYDEGDLLWPDVLTSPGVARSFAQRFTLPTESLVLLGLALPEPCVDDFLESEPGYAGIPRLLRKHEPLAGDAEVLGYEVLAFEHDEFHSWMCTELGEHAVAELNVHPDGAGFLRTLEDAEHVSQWATSDAAGDGKTWLPWLLVRYGWA